MKSALRFAYVFLESLFKRINDDGFAADKAIIVLGCAQVAAGFSIFNLLVAFGVVPPNVKLALGTAFLLALLIVFGSNKLIKGRGELESYRDRYRRMPGTRKFLGGMGVIALLILSIAAVIMTTGIAASFRA